MTELVPLPDTDSWAQVVGPVGQLAERIARTSFVPKALQGQPASVAAAILAGREMGLAPMASLRGIHIVEGRPALTAEMLAARILAAGHRITWVQASDTRCTVRIERADGLSEAEATWTIADAQRAGLAGKQVWRSYPRHMLRARALTEAAAMACPDVALGLDVDGAPAPNAESSPNRDTQTIRLQPIHEPEPEVEPEPDIVNAVIIPTPTVETDPEPIITPAEAEPMISPAQLRKLGALIGDWEAANSRRLDRDERRRMIGFLGGVEDPDALASAKDLTRAQASLAIDTLTDQLEGNATPTDDQGVIE